MLRFAFSLIIQPFDRNILSSSGGCVSTYNKQCYQMVWRRCCIEWWNDERKSRAKHEPECQLSVYKEEWNRSWIVMLLSFRRLPNVKRIHLLWMNITLLNISTIIYVGILSLSHLMFCWVSFDSYINMYACMYVVWNCYEMESLIICIYNVEFTSELTWWCPLCKVETIVVSIAWKSLSLYSPSTSSFYEKDWSRNLDRGSLF